MSEYSFNNKAKNIVNKFIFISISFIFYGCQTFEEKVQRSGIEYNQLVSKDSHPGILEEKVVPLNAIMTIVHIRQQHDSAIYTKVILAQIKKQNEGERRKSVSDFYETQLKINEVQREVLEFVLNNTLERHRVYVEGVPYPRSYRNLFAEAFKKQRQEALEEVLAFSQEELSLPVPTYYLGASFMLHESKQRTVIGVEHGGLLNLTTDIYTNPKLPLPLKKELLVECHEQREDRVIQNIVEPDPEANYIEPTVKFLIFGSKHDFSDKVIKWNEDHPQQQIRLITFTPKSL
ncbi:MAG: hypothetical protein MK132_18370 [Lentisphaerales bacterium]|nr:hypothetical protein [Lentisphaerales bacterium]